MQQYDGWELWKDKLQDKWTRKSCQVPKCVQSVSWQGSVHVLIQTALGHCMLQPKVLYTETALTLTATAEWAMGKAGEFSSYFGIIICMKWHCHISCRCTLSIISMLLNHTNILYINSTACFSYVACFGVPEVSMHLSHSTQTFSHLIFMSLFSHYH